MRRLCEESLELFAGLGDKHGITWVVSNLAILAQREGAWARSARLIGATEAVLDSLGATALSVSPRELRTYQQTIALVQDRLGSTVFASLQVAGRAMSLEEILAFARSDAEQPAEPPVETLPPDAGTTAHRETAGPPDARGTNDRPNPLTRHEMQVAALVARGLTNREIAAELVISEGTVGVHLEHIFGKLELRSRAQLAAWVVEHRDPAADPA